MNLHYLLMCCGLYMLFGGHESTIHSNHIVKSEHNAGTGEEASEAALIIEAAPDHGKQLLSTIQDNEPPPYHRLRQLIAATEDLGRLLVISSGIDFDLRQATLANHGLLIHTGFRASMVQFTNEAWRAFRSTRYNLQHLKVRMDRLPEAVKGTLDALVTGKSANVSENLHIVAGSVEGADEDYQNNKKKLTELSDFVTETDYRLTRKKGELQSASRLQVISAGCGKEQMSDVLSAIDAFKSLKANLSGALVFLNEYVGALNKMLKKRYESVIEKLEMISTLPQAVNFPMVRKALVFDASSVVSEAGLLQTLAEEYLYVSDQCLLTAARFRLFSTLQHLPKDQAALELDQLVHDNNAAWKEAEAFAKRKREQNEKKTVEYERKIKAIVNKLESTHLGVAGSVLGKGAV